MPQQHKPLLKRIIPGIKPSSVTTSFATSHYSDGDKVRFVDFRPKKIGGWEGITFDDSNAISGVPRSLYSLLISTNQWLLIGTHTRLYSLYSTELKNITPLVTATTAVANSLNTNYATLANNPITTVNGSGTITLNYAALTDTKLAAGDIVTISGAATTNGILNTVLNASHTVQTVNTSAETLTIVTTGTASSSGSGGGASVVLKTSLIGLTKATHGFADGDRVKILAAADTGGILAAAINLEFVIRYETANKFSFSAATIATSSVSAAGGAATTIQGQIAAGNSTATYGIGYGANQYSTGQYSSALQDATALIEPRRWIFDRYGELAIMTPGQQTGLYSWAGDTAIAPVLVTNAPTAINYAFTDHEIVVTLGASGVGNRIQWSDQGGLTTWTATATNQAGDDDIEGAGKFISHLKIKDVNLLFTPSQIYKMVYIGPDLIWDIKQETSTIGIVAQNARVEFAGKGYFVANNFEIYQYNGGLIEKVAELSDEGSLVPNNMGKHIVSDINKDQKSKIFCRIEPDFSELWIHYPTQGSSEPDAYVMVNLESYVWSKGTLDRIAAEYPLRITDNSRLSTYGGGLYQHEYGTDDDGSAMDSYFDTPYFGGETETVMLTGIIHDGYQVGNMTLTPSLKNYPRGSEVDIAGAPFTVTPTTEYTEYQPSEARMWKYRFRSNVIGGDYHIGEPIEIIANEGAEQ